MENQMKLFWELYYKNVSNEHSIKLNYNPIRGYDVDFINGAIIDIGCGQSPLLLEYSNTDREIIALDSEQIQLDFLKKRVIQQEEANIKNWTFLLSKFPEEDIPQKNYALVILSNILHFFTLEQCIEIGAKIKNSIQSGSLIYICVHSHKHYSNNPNDPENDNYFKHYFRAEDLNKIFDNSQFEHLYIAEIDRKDNPEEIKLVQNWLNEYYKSIGVNSIEEREFYIQEYFKDKSQSYIQAIYRKKQFNK